MNLNNMFDLTGKTVVITGGAGYLGSAMSDALAAFGANLFILGSDYNKNVKEANILREKYDLSICESMPFSIDCHDMIRKVFSKIFEKTGSLDVLINNAAYCSASNLEDYTLETWCNGIDGTINGVFNVTQQALKYMLTVGHGNIINIGSMYGMVAPNMEIYGDSGQNNPANYGAGKAAIIQFTKYLASVYGGKGIRANTVSPGPFPNIETQKNKKFIKNLCSKNPLHKIGQPKDLQGIIVYLASDASGYLTGQNIAVDGGWTVW